MYHVLVLKIDLKTLFFYRIENVLTAASTYNNQIVKRP